MQPQCAQAVNQAVGRDLSEAELKAVESRISRHMRQNAARDPQATLAMPADQRFIEAARSAAEEYAAEAAKKIQRVALQVIANAKIEQHLGQFVGNKLDGLARMLAFHADGKSNFMPIESRARAVERDALRQMIGTMEATNPKFFGLFENREGVRNLVRELFGESTGVKEAADGAQQFKKVAEALRERFNRAGGNVGELEDWGMPHHHAQVKVAKAGRDQWVNDLMPFIDRSRYYKEDGARMSDQEVRAFLGQAWETIATGGVNKLVPGQSMGSGMRANRGDHSRQIHFKDADSYLDYQEIYGERTAYDVIIGHIAGVSKDIALVETLGPNPDHAYRLIRDKVMQEATLADPTQLGQIEKKVVNLDNLYNGVSGKTLPVASQRLAETFDTLRSWLVASRLGSAVISSISDEATMYLSAHVNNLPKMRLFANELSALNIANQAEKRMALRAGLAMNTFISSLNRFGQDGLGAAFAPKLATAVLRASGLNALTEARRRAFGVTMYGSIGQITREFDTMASIDAMDHRLLKASGITETEFAVWKRATLEDWGGGNDHMLTPDAIYRIPDEALAGLADDLFPDIPLSAQVLKERAATKLLGIVLEESNVAVIEPGVKERALMLSHLQRGTWKGELTRSFFLFKSFPISMITKHWSRAMGNPSAKGKAGYLAALIAGTTVAGAASLQINELLNGRDPRNMNPLKDGGGKTWMAAMLKGGSLGLYGDFLFSQSTQYGQSPVASLLGPVIGLGESMFNLTQGNLIEAAQGKGTNAGAEAIRFARSNLPGANLWYAKGALDHMIFHQLQEYFSPGYLSQMRRRAQREFGQSYWWQPGQPLPNKGPDMGKLVGD